MSFVTIKGLNGKVFIPDMKDWEKKKNPCPDCYSCNMCSDDRCTLCLKHKKNGNSGNCANCNSEPPKI